ncbi:MAG: L-aspartate oxidase [Promethearchaeota archaeon]
MLIKNTFINGLSMMAGNNFNTTMKTDFLVVGSGLSGLSLAIKLAKIGQVLVITKKSKQDSNSSNAQGGIAVVLSGEEDSIKKHLRDTIKVGDGLCDESVVEKIVTNGARCVNELIDMGVPFTKNANGDFDLGKEGGHSQRRVLHAGDITGNEVQKTLLGFAEEEPNLTIIEKMIAINLVVKNNQCLGLYALDSENGDIVSIFSRFTILATGGAGKVYLYTSNPDIATGDGIAMAYRAGAKIANMEFFQFHPTCLYHPHAKSFLISEALRGEGAILLNDEGERFMLRYHKLAELAPRDTVSRAIDHEMKVNGLDCVYLDISFKDPDFIKKRFPNIYKKCLSFNIDITKEPIPVVPAAHYTCGGILAGVDGTTNIKRLHAVGETSCTGFHGANRLASNSLLECVVMADFTAKYIKRQMETNPPPIKPFESWDIGNARPSKEAVVVKHNWDEIRSVMWNYVGIVRSNKNLGRAASRIKIISDEIKEYYWNYLITSDLVELRHLITIAELIIKAALNRRESRGTHYNIDYPDKLSTPMKTVIFKNRVKLEPINTK